MAISEAWFHRLKAATRDLVKVCGGVVRSGEVAGYSKTEVGRWQSATDTDIIPIPAVLALEADSGRAFVTAVMAELNDRRLGEPGADGREAASLARTHAEISRAVGEASIQLAIAQEDGVITPTEAEKVDRVYADAERWLGDARQTLANARVRVVGGGR
jgi:hypothetical protein